jgi:phosphate starvation-inducible PhoH-like protein
VVDDELTESDLKEANLSKRRNHREIENTNTFHTNKRNKQQRVELTLVTEQSPSQYRSKPIELIPKSLNQETYIDLLTDPKKLIIFATGPAGTGKTMLAVLAAIKAYRDGECKKIVITRPAVGVENESHGFLPGDINQKMEPWARPVLDIFSAYYKQPEITRMIDEKIIELAPLAFQRGRTFRNSWVIVDESQNMTINQMKMILTRLGDNSKAVITGDLNQTDKQFFNNNGLHDFIERMSASDSAIFGHIDFIRKDIQRSKAVAEVLKLYGED